MIILLELSSYRRPLSAHSFIHSFDLIESYIIDINISLPMRSNKKNEEKKKSKDKRNIDSIHKRQIENKNKYII